MTSALKQNQKHKLTKSYSIFTRISPVNLAFGTIISLLLISSCSDPATVGIELAPGNNQIGVVFEEFDLPAEVVLLDSFYTTNQSILVVGEEEDDFFGKTSATGYSRLSIGSGADRPDQDALLDSVVFSLNIQDISGTALDKPKYYSIHKLTEPLLDTLYYNFDALSYESNPFSSGEIVFGEATDSLASFQVEEEFAEELFSKMQLGVEFNDLFTFRDYFPGIAVKARVGDNSTIGVGIGGSTGLKVYYHSEGDTASTVYNISTASSRSFNGIKSDRSGTPTEVVTETQKAYDVGSKVGMKSMLGMVIKLDTSPFDAFLDTLSGITFNQVVLELGEIDNQPDTQIPPNAIIMHFTDASNKILETSTGIPYSVQADGQVQVYTDENGVLVPNTSSPTALFYNSEDKVYSQYITSHVNALFRGKLTRKDWLLYADIPSSSTTNFPNSGGDDFKRSLRQFVVNKNKVKVKVIYSKTR
ncbi:DUF4270 family protein [Algoriphagus sp. D3-2-R+10]|uniref:DUF4270 family protein n=1 Tax=Algoriphagus aurantiacus TaxID=3103948 RepID=UPI002B3DD71A|nr:DUF4270 family protein [Algoriphagus sp. D3-2-R+10]MEB2774725.1 DUF4270 family protein [Algoriphagus sp. D3-2-R+10]